MSVTFRFRPLGLWIEGDTKPRRGAHLFKSSWESTLALLGKELEYLRAKNVVIQADFTERDIRLDGMPRADARQPSHPGIRVAFDSKYGPLIYATDAYERQCGHGLQGWQANVRAIALGLKALRDVDRYGVTKRGEQYTGWKQLEAGPARAFPSLDAAAAFVAEHSGLPADGGDLMVEPGVVDGALLVRLHRFAARRLHPDAGGDRAQFDRLQQAKAQLEKAAR
jgi:hypothetical protein